MDKLEELKRQQEELAAEIDNIKKDIGNALVEEDVTIKTSYVSKRLIQGNITHRSVTKYLKQHFYNNKHRTTSSFWNVYFFRENVHIMVLPVAETIEKQLMVVLRDREKDLTEFLGMYLWKADLNLISVEH